MKTLYSPGDIVILDFPGIQRTKRRPAVVLSSNTYHTTRPDLIIGLITSQIATANNPSDILLQDWGSAGLRLPSAFRSFIVTYAIVF
jgi:mRNA interferase MazF